MGLEHVTSEGTGRATTADRGSAGDCARDLGPWVQLRWCQLREPGLVGNGLLHLHLRRISRMPYFGCEKNDANENSEIGAQI